MTLRKRPTCVVCDVGYDSRRSLRRCRVCGTSVQTLVDGKRRHPIDGDFRVVCEGEDGDGVCPIGPSEPTPLITSAQERLAAHHAEAAELGDDSHHAKIVRLSADPA